MGKSGVKKMRLIDANKIKEELKLKELSHIIKQEEYLDYVLNEWKTRVVELGSYNVVEEIDNAPTVEAIPIEWVEDYIKKHTFTFRIYDTTNENDLDAITTNELTLVSKMLKDWKEENDR